MQMPLNQHAIGKIEEQVYLFNEGGIAVWQKVKIGLLQ